MEKWALRSDETQAVCSASFNNKIGFASPEHFSLLEVLYGN